MQTDSHFRSADSAREPEVAARAPKAPWFAGLAWWALAGVSLAADFAMVPILSSLRGPPSPLLAGVLGCTLAQGSLLAAWLVLFEGPFWLRLARHWGVALGLWLVWFFGLSLVAPGTKEFLAVGFTAACITPLVSLGAQLPIWVVRQIFGWRVTRSLADRGHSEARRLSIRDLLAAMLVTAVTFAVLRAAPAFQREDDFRIVVVLGVAIAGVVSTIAILPAAVMLLWPRPFARGLALTGVYTLTLVGIHWFIVGIVRWYGGPLGPYQIHAGLSAIMLSYCGTCCLAAYVARQGGYRLARHDGRRAA